MIKIQHELENNMMAIKFEGRLDAVTSTQAENELSRWISEGHKTVAIDMSNLTFLSSAGIRVLLAAYKQLEAIGGQLSVLRPTPEVLNVLRLAGVDQILVQQD